MFSIISFLFFYLSVLFFYDSYKYITKWITLKWEVSIVKYGIIYFNYTLTNWELWSGEKNFGNNGRRNNHPLLFFIKWEQIEVLYLKDTWEAVIKSYFIFEWIVLLFIFFCNIVGSVYFYRKKNNIDNVLANWLLIKAKINKIDMKIWTYENYFYINCEAVDKNTWKKYIFISEDLWFDPKPFIKEYIDVYVEQYNYEKYFIDIRGIIEENKKKPYKII